MLFRSLVLTETLAITPYGVTGELYLGGPGCARGYFNQPALTSERFIDNPYYDKSRRCSSQRLYRSGDLVRYAPDGNLMFVGRNDDQVKIRGFRVELAEVEQALRLLQGVDSCLVTAKALRPGEPQLVAYVKLADDSMRATEQAMFI